MLFLDLPSIHRLIYLTLDIERMSSTYTDIRVKKVFMEQELLKEVVT
ncbi:hypothetical protein C678_0727 [Clostridioides difficile F665]|nr:hypothetical protein C678_0727 [Clostridioides difficile F665]